MYTENSFASLHIDRKWRKLLAEAANHGLSQGTWSSYKSALKALKACETETGKCMNFPLSGQEVLTFVAWLANKGLTQRTISVYLAGIRQCHLVRGVELPILRSPVVNMVLEGKKHADLADKKKYGDDSRLPMTPALMKLLKEEIRNDSIHPQLKLLLWSVSTLAFNGGFRVHELLCRKVNTFDPSVSLLGQDLIKKTCTIKGRRVNTLQILLKSEKQDRIGKSTIVDVYSSGGALCPLKAFEKWKASNPPVNARKPAFRDPDGKPVTGRRFNAYLKKYLAKYTKGSRRKITSHSFRGGLASLMGELGFSDNEIKAVGRWSSRCFEDYLKLPRTRRLEMARKIGNLHL